MFPLQVRSPLRWIKPISTKLYYSSHPSPSQIKQKSLTDIKKLYKNKEPITVVTAHDYITGRLADESNADIVLIGDSLGMVSKGYASTLEIPFDDYYYACQSVLRGVNSKFIIADLPFGSFQVSLEQCIENSVKLMKLGKIGSIKIEGSYELSDEISRLTKLGIPVTGHIGLQPQKFNSLGGYKVQGKLSSDALDIYKEALHLQKLGASLLLMECVPYKLAEFITNQLSIPTIGIGSGNGTSAQVLVMSDILGMLNNKPAKFVKQYMQFHESGLQGLNEYSNDVKSGSFPNNSQHGFTIKDDEFNNFLEQAKDIKV